MVAALKSKPQHVHQPVYPGRGLANRGPPLPRWLSRASFISNSHLTNSRPMSPSVHICRARNETRENRILAIDLARGREVAIDPRHRQPPDDVASSVAVADHAIVLDHDHRLRLAHHIQPITQTILPPRMHPRPLA